MIVRSSRRSCPIDERRERALALQFRDHVEDAAAHEHVDAHRGVVGDQERRLQDEGAGERDALPLAAAQLVRVLRHHGERKPHRVDEGRDGRAGLDPVEVPIARVDRLGDVLADREPRLEGRPAVLRQVADVQGEPVALASRAAAQLLAEHLQVPADDARGFPLPVRALGGDRPGEGGLAGAGLSDDAEDGPDLEGEGHPVDRDVLVARIGERDVIGADREPRRQCRSSSLGHPR